MVQPINYGAVLAPTSPLDPDAFMRGAQGGQVLVQNMQNRQIAQAQAEQAQAQAMKAQTDARLAIEAARAKAQADAERKAALAKLSQPGTPLAEFGRVAVIYPEISEQIKRSQDMLTDAERQTKFTVGARALALHEAGMTEEAAALLEEESARNEASGRPEEAKSYSLNAQAMRKAPTQARSVIATFLASADPEKFAQIEADISSNPATVAKREAEAGIATVQELSEGETRQADIDFKKAQTAKIRAETAAMVRAMNAAKDPTAPPRPLETDERKSVNEAAKEAVALGAKAENLDSLAAKIEADAKAKGTWQKASDAAMSMMDPTGLGKMAERKIRTFMGTEDQETELYNEFERFKASGVVEALPQGAASDNDISMIRAGFPGANANDAYKAKWLRAYASVTKDIQRVKRAETIWQSANQGGGLGPAQRDFILDGKPVRAGQSFVDFVAKPRKDSRFKSQ